MKKTSIALFLCLLMVFGAITVLWSNSDLEKAYEDAESKLKTLIIRTEPLRTKLKVLTDRRNTLTKGKWKLVIGMLNPIEIAKILALDAGAINELFKLDRDIIAVEIELEPYQAELAMLESARDAAYEKYVATLSPSEEKPDPVDVTYVTVPEYRVECRNLCGTIFSSKVVTLAKLRDTAERAHLILCPVNPKRREK